MPSTAFTNRRDGVEHLLLVGLNHVKVAHLPFMCKYSTALLFCSIALTFLSFHKGETLEYHNEWPGTDETFKENVIESYKHFLQLTYRTFSLCIQGIHSLSLSLAPERCKTFALSTLGDDNCKPGADVTVMNDADDEATSAQQVVEQGQDTANEPSKKSTRKTKTRITDIDDESSDESDIVLTDSEEPNEIETLDQVCV